MGASLNVGLLLFQVFQVFQLFQVFQVYTVKEFFVRDPFRNLLLFAERLSEEEARSE